ncbi:MAG TPA: GTP 3',8-cyclase MoaA [Dehalococcoidia bacterium]|nr:GTP 3',8-cyclase MoaA [Dehalococcoidia bacterium]
MIDSFSRRINYMRISVTDRCDLRCIYCTDRFDHKLRHDDILRYEEIHLIVQAAARLGVKKLRLTGGEALTRLHLSRLVDMLAHTEGIEEVSLTTNGTHLAQHVEELKAAGLSRVNVSLDSLKPSRFEHITGGGQLKDVLAGIEAAKEADLNPVKINMVVLRGVNDAEVLDFARKTLLDDGWHVRFIEHMPFINGNGRNGTVAVRDIMSSIEHSLGKLEPHFPTSGNGPARYYKLPDAPGTLGFIGAVTECFCAECNRFRLTADGHLRPCLLDDDEIDLKEPLRSGADIAELERLILEAATRKQQQHHLRENGAPEKRQMWQIGG